MPLFCDLALRINAKGRTAFRHPGPELAAGQNSRFLRSLRHLALNLQSSGDHHCAWAHRPAVGSDTAWLKIADWFQNIQTLTPPLPQRFDADGPQKEHVLKELP